MNATAPTSPDWRTDSLTDLIRRAIESGVDTVQFVELPPTIGGLYDHDGKTILIDPYLRPHSLRLTLAHEIIHAERGHDRTIDQAAHDDVEAEAQRRLGHTTSNPDQNPPGVTMTTQPQSVPDWCTLHSEFGSDVAIGAGPAYLIDIDGADIAVQLEWDETNGTTVSLSRTVSDETTHLDELTIGQAQYLSEALQRTLNAIGEGTR